MTKDRPHRRVLGDPSTSARDDQYVFTCALRQRTLNSRRLRKQFKAGTNINVSDQTIRNRLHASNLRARRPVVRQLLTRQHRTPRQQWALVHHRSTRVEWRMVMFSDESRYSVEHPDGRTRVWRWPAERYAAPHIASHDRVGGGGGGLSNGLSRYLKYMENNLVVVNGNMNWQRYLNGINVPVVVPNLQSWLPV